MDSATKPGRHNSICPTCRYRTATFVARTDEGALYRCANDHHRSHRSRTIYFQAPHPRPLRVDRYWIREAA